MQNAERSTRAAEQDGSGKVIDAAVSFGPAKIYDLTCGQPNSDAFYGDVAEFADRVVREAEFRGAPLLDEYSEYLRFATEEASRSRGEYALELLTLVRRGDRAASSLTQLPAHCGHASVLHLPRNCDQPLRLVWHGGGWGPGQL